MSCLFFPRLRMDQGAQGGDRAVSLPCHPQAGTGRGTKLCPCHPQAGTGRGQGSSLPSWSVPAAPRLAQGGDRALSLPSQGVPAAPSPSQGSGSSGLAIAALRKTTRSLSCFLPGVFRESWGCSGGWERPRGCLPWCCSAGAGTARGLCALLAARGSSSPALQPSIIIWFIVAVRAVPLPVPGAVCV